VLDASVALAMVLPDEAHPVAERALDLIQAAGATVPAIWWFELRNALIMAERRKRISVVMTRKVVSALAMLPISIDRGPAGDTTMRLARAHRLSIYDAAYLELAMRISSPLASLDRALIKAARAEHVGVVGQ
jgi:predicted nucleic acid-binding protein